MAQLVPQGHASAWRHKAMTAGPEKYFLLLCVAQLIKCVDALPDEGLPLFSNQELLRDLRNIEEHWEASNGRSIRRVRTAIPDIEPGRIISNNKHIWIEGVDLMEILAWTVSVHRQLRLNAETRGEPLPEEPSPQGFHRVHGQCGC